MNGLDELRAQGWSEEVVAFAGALDADGYDVELERLSDGRISGQVTARPDACEECLVPKQVMSSILAAACEVDADRVELRYPTDAAEGR